MRKLTKAFKELRELDYLAVRKYACCRSCAMAEMPDEKENLYVYTTDQSDEPQNYFIYWSAPNDDPTEIIKVLRKHGLKVTKPKSPAWSIQAKEY
tara:strand:- start:5336 stop:5620 length:285 start_codon:yes stop_codon:yes gene_type:complete